MTIVLYELCGEDPAHLFSAHCWKVRMSLAHKGLDFETVPVPFTGISGVENGVSKTLPVIRDGGTVVSDSLAIARYLDETYPDTPSVLAGEQATALTSFVLNWTQSQLHPEVVKQCLVDIHNALAPADQDYFRTSREKLFGMTLEDFAAKHRDDGEALQATLVPLVLTLKRQPFVAGEQPLFADYIVFGALQWMRVCCSRPLTLPDEVQAWFDRLLDMYDGMGRATKSAS